MGWFEDNAAKLQAAGIPEAAARDFVARNPGHEGRGGDYHRIFEALGPEYARREEAPPPFVAPSAPASSFQSPSAPAQRDWFDRQPISIPYTPWTEQFQPTVALPADLLDKWTEQFQPTVAFPGDLLDKWTRPWTPPTYESIQSSPAYRFRVDEALKALERSAAARGSYLTPNTMRALQEASQGLASEEYGNEFARQRGTYEGDFNIFSADQSRRSNTYFNQLGSELDRFKTRYDIAAQDKARRADVYFNQLDRDTDRYSTRYNIFRQNQLDPFGMGVTLGQERRADRGQDFDIDTGLWRRAFEDRGQAFSMNDITRKFDFNRDQDAWMRAQSAYDKYMDNLYRFSEMGTRRPPR